MTRRASLPGAEELFRNTEEQQKGTDTSSDQGQYTNPQVSSSPSLQVAKELSQQEAKQPRHDEKVTFYCTAEDLTRLERARLGLRAEHRLASDRGRIVRAALTEILDDFESRGPNSALVRRLQDGLQ